jgi:MazG family protein
MNQTLSNFKNLIETVRALRGQNGCPWDKKQTTESLEKYLHEEFAEIIEAIHKKDSENLCEELGDFLYLILMLSEINRQNGSFSLENIIQTINEKLIRRHPHVFDGKEIEDEHSLTKQWQQIKQVEKSNKKID